MRVGKTVVRHVAVLLGIALLVLVVAACNDATSTTSSQATTTVGSLAAATSTDDTGTPIPTVKPSPSPTGPGAQGGVADICSEAASVTVHPPNNIPSYPGSTLHISQVDPSDSSNVFYGYCTSAAVQDVFTYYQQQLPGKGWGNVSTYSVDTVRQVKATQGQAQITVSVSPSAVLANTTNIFITVIGG